MKELIIKVNGETLRLKFGFGFLMLLGERWSCKGPYETMNYFINGISGLIKIFENVGVNDVEKVKQLQDAGESFDVPFSEIEVLVDILELSAKAASTDMGMNRGDIADYIFENPSVMGEIIKTFFESMPKPEAEKPGKLEPGTGVPQNP